MPVHRQSRGDDQVAGVIDQAPAVARPDAGAIVAVHRRRPFGRVIMAKAVAQPRRVAGQNAVFRLRHLVDAAVFGDLRFEIAGLARGCDGLRCLGRAETVTLARCESQADLIEPCLATPVIKVGHKGLDFAQRYRRVGAGHGDLTFGMGADRVQMVGFVAVGVEYLVGDHSAGRVFDPCLGLTVACGHSELQ